MTSTVAVHQREFSTVTARNPSGFWGDCPFESIQKGTMDGNVFWDDFLDLPTGRHTATPATAGTFKLTDAVGGVALADSGSTTATQGINVQLNSAVGELFRPADTRTLWFEARIKAADIATGPEFFLGLSSILTTIIASSANTSPNHIGWESVSDDGVLLMVSENAGTRVAGKTSHTLVDDAWVRLGFKVNGITSIDHYVNGAIQSTTQVTANIPILEMVPSLVCQSGGGTVDPIVHIDWWKVVSAERRYQ